MKVIIFTVIMLTVSIVTAQRNQTDASIRLDVPGAKETLMRSLKLTDSTFGLILSKNNDTTKAIVYYSLTSMLARMQSFVLTDDHQGHTILYNPSNIAGFIVVFTDDTMKFISVNNDLGIVSSLRQNAMPSFDQKKAGDQNAQRNKVFLNCLVDGNCRLFKYNIGAGYAVKDDPGNEAHPPRSASGINGNPQSNGSFHSERENGESMMFTKTKYCIQKNNGVLIPLNNTSIESVFSDCSEMGGISGKEILKDEKSLKQLVVKYNKWRDSFDASRRY